MFKRNIPWVCPATSKPAYSMSLADSCPCSDSWHILPSTIAELGRAALYHLLEQGSSLVPGMHPSSLLSFLRTIFFFVLCRIEHFHDELSQAYEFVPAGCLFIFWVLHLYLFIWYGKHTCRGETATCVGQSSLLLCAVWILNTVNQVWQQAPSFGKPSWRPSHRLLLSQGQSAWASAM